jgi:hypothetical protein
MRLAAKSKEHIRYARDLFHTGRWVAMCNEIWAYGEFDFFYDLLRHLQYKYKSELYRAQVYNEIVEIFFSPMYNANLMNPQQGEPRRDKWMDFYMGGKEIKSIKQLLNN